MSLRPAQALVGTPYIKKIQKEQGRWLKWENTGSTRSWVQSPGKHKKIVLALLSLSLVTNWQVGGQPLYFLTNHLVLPYNLFLFWSPMAVCVIIFNSYMLIIESLKNSSLKFI
jgi:hypothetical protein